MSLTVVIPILSSMGFQAVSYTQLEVYKRQGILYVFQHDALFGGGVKEVSSTGTDNDCLLYTSLPVPRTGVC